MNLVWHESAEDFVSTFQDLAQGGTASYTLVLGLAMRHAVPAVQRQPSPPLLATIQGKSCLLGAAYMTPPRKLIVSVEPEAAPFLARGIHDRKWPVSAVHINKPSGETFAAEWSTLTRTRHRLDVMERLYTAFKICPAQHVAGLFRSAYPDDAEQLIAWQLDFLRAALPEDPLDEDEVRSGIHDDIRQKNRYVWDSNGLVSTAVQCRPTPSGTGITGVYTPPELRRCGYATACVARLSQQILDSGRSYCYLFTDLSNPTSNSIYQKIGYSPVCDFQNFFFEIVNDGLQADGRPDALRDGG
jgi:ribosomal protein S18 acetylase RimI-like enzyme